MASMEFSPAAVEAAIAELTTHVAGVCSVARVEDVTPRMRRVVLHGDALAGLDGRWRPEMMLRLYFPPAGHADPPEPYVGANGRIAFRTLARNAVDPYSPYAQDPLVRAYTARSFRAHEMEVDVDFVIHEAPGIASDWARGAKPGDRLGVVEYLLPTAHRGAADHQADVYVLFGDEAALPAMQTSFEAFAPGTRVIAFVEVEDADEEQPVDTRADLTLTWLHRNGVRAGTSTLLMDALRSLDWPDGDVYCSVSAEIRTVSQMRTFIKQERGMQRGRYKTQAYWRLGKTEVERMERMTELTIRALRDDPRSYAENHESIGMNIVDDALFDDPIYEQT